LANNTQEPWEENDWPMWIAGIVSEKDMNPREVSPPKTLIVRLLLRPRLPLTFWPKQVMRPLEKRAERRGIKRKNKSREKKFHSFE
jgi:hypothetical protein